jgi:gas vesicle protein
MGKKAGKIALLAGLVTGAVTGLLFAPDEGKNIRNKIAKGDHKGLLDDIAHMGEEIGDMVGELVARPSVQEALDGAKDKIADVAEMERAELDKMLKNANKKADDFKKKVEKYVKEQKAILDKKTGKKKSTTKKKKTTSKKTSTKKPSTKKSTTTKKKK